jgi:hypothetical protein
MDASLTQRVFVQPRHGDDRYDALKNTYQEPRERDAAPRRHHRALPRHEPDLGSDATISFRGVTTIAARWFQLEPSETVSRVAAR